jgi:predicted PurR-regulated permease PerM
MTHDAARQSDLRRLTAEAGSSAASSDWPRFLAKLTVVTITVVAVALVWLTREVLLLVFGGVLLGVFLCGLTRLAVRYLKLPRAAALTLTITLLTAAACSGLWFLGSEIVEQFGELRSGLTKAFAQVHDRIEKSPAAGLVPQPSEGEGPSAAQLTAFAGYVTSGIGALAAPLVLLVIGVFLAVDPLPYRRGFLLLVPPRHRGLAGEMLQRAADALWGWTWGRLFSMSLIGVTTYVGLLLLGVPLALSLALIAFATNFIPYIGPLLSAVPAVLIAFSIGPTQAVYVLVLYAGIQLVETNVITPLVEQHSVNLPPVFTLSWQLAAGLLLGPLGILFATPLAALGVILVRTLYIEPMQGEWPRTDSHR